MENQEKVDNKYNIFRAWFEPMYLVRRSQEIIKDQERVLGNSPGKDLLMRVSWGYDIAKIAIAAGITYGLAEKISEKIF